MHFFSVVVYGWCEGMKHCVARWLWLMRRCRACELATVKPHNKLCLFEFQFYVLPRSA